MDAELVPAAPQRRADSILLDHAAGTRAPAEMHARRRMWWWNACRASCSCGASSNTYGLASLLTPNPGHSENHRCGQDAAWTLSAVVVAIHPVVTLAGLLHSMSAYA